MSRTLSFASMAVVTIAASSAVDASSHREAPFISENPRVDNTDLYAFRSYEAGREGYVTILANYIPFQDPYGGPIFYDMDPDARYDINIDNDGDARPDISFRFWFSSEYQEQALNVGGVMVPIPIIQSGPIGPGANDTAALNRLETYGFNMVQEGQFRPVRHAETGDRVFKKPVDNIGNKTIANYDAYAAEHVYEIKLPCECENGRVFVGQRREGFVINVGEVFDLINLNPLGAPNAEENTLKDKNVTTIALELPIQALTSGGDPVIGVWATASKPRTREIGPDARVAEEGEYIQVSRLGHALVNEVVIGLPDKDLFNARPPSRDAALLKYVTNPTLPALIETLFPAAKAPTVFPRDDLVNVFLKGVEGLNRPKHGVPAEVLRLNTSIAPVPATNQDPLGVLGDDTAGYPNGRRPGDDVVDISLRVAMGALLPAEKAPAGQLPLTDGAYVDATQFDETFPYLRAPLPGSPAEESPAE